MERVTLYFFFLCIPIRLLEVALLGVIMQQELMGKYYNALRATMGITLGIQMSGFFMSDILGRKKTMMGVDKWWTSSVHGVVFCFALCSVIVKFEYAFVFLLVDVGIGLWNWYQHHG